jgi:hypothetical protein
VLAENPFKGETKTLCCPPRRGVQGIAFPFQAPHTQITKAVTYHEVNGFGGFAGLLQARGHPDMTYFDDTVCGIIAHERAHSHGLACIPAHEGIEPGVAGSLAGFYPFGEFLK